MTPRKPDINQKIRDEQRTHILNSAMTIFCRKGYAAAKVSDIATEARVSQGLVYNYFPSKDALFSDVVRNMMNGLESAVIDSLNIGGSPEESIRSLCRTMHTGVLEWPEYWTLVVEFSKAEAIPNEARDCLAEYNERLLRAITNVFKAGQQAGIFVDENPYILASFLVSVFNGFALNNTNIPKDKRTIPSVDLIMRAFCR